jgi:uncharacterized protein YdeI (YjbR/CyaY-like superfamily)|nr:hypothetical protein [uncultured Bacteroides sp.]
MKAKVVLIMLLIPILMGSSCGNDDKDCHDRIVFLNKTSSTLYVKKEESIILSRYNGYPYSDWYKALPNEKNNTALFNVFSGRSDCYENTLKDTLYIFIFEEDVLANHSWADVVDKNLVLQRYNLSLHDLQQLNWQISYPPSEQMKDMKMYPPFP